MFGSVTWVNDRSDSEVDLVAESPSRRVAEPVHFATHDRVVGNDWAVAWATRNRIAHGYAYVFFDAIQATVDHDLPKIESALRSEVGRLKQTSYAADWSHVVEFSQGD